MVEYISMVNVADALQDHLNTSACPANPDAYWAKVSGVI
jgi:hypothetical protein